MTELCEEWFYEAAVELLAHTERCFRGDLCYLYTRRLDRALRRKQNVVNFLFEEELGEEEEEVAALGRIFCSLNHATGTDQRSRLIHTPSVALCPEPDLPEVYPLCPDNSAPQSDALAGDERLESSLSDLTVETQDQESSEENKDSFSSDRSGGEEEEEEEGQEEGDQTPVFLLETEERGEGENER